MPEAMQWLQSAWSIRLQAVAALVFQLAGVVLVVQDIWHNNRQLTLLLNRFRAIDKEQADTSSPFNEVLDNLPSTGGKTVEQLNDDFEKVFSAPFLLGAAADKAVADKVAALASLQDDDGRRWRSWTSVILLVLGILFSFTTTICGLR